MRKRGRRVSLIDVELTQGDRTAVRAAVTLGEPENITSPPLLSVNPVVPLMPPEPPPGLEPIGPGHPMADIVHLAHGCDIRPSLTTLEPRTDGGPPVIEYWVRPKGVAPDVLFALLCGDVSAPVTFGVNRFGWAPTVQLTAYLRALPADGWLRVMCTTVQIGQDWFDEDHIVVDCEGRIIVQSRQLAMVPPPAPESNRWRRLQCFARGQNRDHRRRKYRRGTAVRAASRRAAGQGPGGRREGPRAREVSVRDVLGVGDHRWPTRPRTPRTSSSRSSPPTSMVIGEIADAAAQAENDSAEQVFVTVAAGSPPSSTRSKLPAGAPVIRVMPNAPVVVGGGVSALARGRFATAEQLKEVSAIFDAVGGVLTVPGVADSTPSPRCRDRVRRTSS